LDSLPDKLRLRDAVWDTRAQSFLAVTAPLLKRSKRWKRLGFASAIRPLKLGKLRLPQLESEQARDLIFHFADFCVCFAIFAVKSF
jgi:hypothetical protein